MAITYKGVRKTAKRYSKKVGSNLKKRYFKGKGYKNPKFFQMAKDVTALKHLLNVEKKTYLMEERTPIVLGLSVGSGKTSTSIDGEAVYSNRDNVERSGAYVKTNLIGTIAQGTADGQIIGERAKMVSYHMDYRIKAVRGVTTGAPSWGKQKTKVRIYLIMMPRGDQVLTDDITAQNQEEVLLQRFFEPSVFDTTYDGTRRNIEYMKDFTILSSKVVTFNHDELTDGQVSEFRYDNIYEGKMGGKCDHHIRYNGSKLIKNQLALIAIPDSGSVEGVTADFNHYTLEYSMKMYYVDN